MSATPNLQLPYILPAQAQKHVTHNEAIRALDCIVQLAVLDRDLSAPPASPQDGTRYIVGPAPEAEWSGHAGEIAAWQDGAWMYHAPQEGWLAWVADEGQLVSWSDDAWTGISSSASQDSAPLFGINTSADLVNRLAVKSDAVLLTHDDVTPGSGDIRIAINKADADATASFVFQSGYSARAEIGLITGDDLGIKVSSNGTSFTSALQIDASDGTVALPQGAVIGSGNEAVELFTRGAETPGYGVPVFRAAAANTPTALDVMPNGTPTIDPTGLAWIHVLKQDLKTAADKTRWQACTVAARADEVAIGSMSGGGMPVLPLGVAGSNIVFKSQLTGSGTVTYAQLGPLGFTLALNTTQDASLWMFTDWMRLKSGYQIRWTNSATTSAATPDLGIGRAAAGVLEVNTGTAGNLGQIRARSVRPASYTVATVPSAAAEGAGAIIYVSNASVGATLAVSDGAGWRMLSSSPLS